MNDLKRQSIINAEKEIEQFFISLNPDKFNPVARKKFKSEFYQHNLRLEKLYKPKIRRYE